VSAEPEPSVIPISLPEFWVLSTKLVFLQRSPSEQQVAARPTKTAKTPGKSAIFSGCRNSEGEGRTFESCRVRQILDRRIRGRQRFPRAGRDVADRPPPRWSSAKTARPSTPPAVACRWHGRNADTPQRRQWSRRRASPPPARSVPAPAAFSATGAAAAEHAHPGHIGLGRRDFNALVDWPRGLQRFRERGLAPWASGQSDINHAVGVRMQRPACARAALTRGAIRAGGRTIFLLSRPATPVMQRLTWCSGSDNEAGVSNYHNFAALQQMALDVMQEAYY